MDPGKTSSLRAITSTSTGGLAPRAPRAMPAGVAAAILGALATTALVVGAVALRAPMADEGDEATGATAAASAAAPPSADGEPAATTAPTSTAIGAATAAAPSEDVAAGAGDPRAREIWDKLLSHLRAGRYDSASTSLEELLELDPVAYRDRSVRAATVDLAVRLELTGGPAADRVFDIMATRFGPSGADVLYELVATRGGSRAAARAARVLADPTVRERGTPALRVAYDLRNAKRCDDKISLLDRAAKDGDGRSYGMLQELNRPCRRRGGECCLHNDDRLKAAMAAIRDRQ